MHKLIRIFPITYDFSLSYLKMVKKRPNLEFMGASCTRFAYKINLNLIKAKTVTICSLFSNIYVLKHIFRYQPHIWGGVGSSSGKNI